MPGGNIRIVLVEPGGKTSDSYGTVTPQAERRHTVWADRRDGPGDTFAESRVSSTDAEVIFRIRDFGPKGLRPTTDWTIIDTYDGDRPYRITRVVRVKVRAALRSNWFDLYGSFRGGRRAAA